MKITIKYKEVTIDVNPNDIANYTELDATDTEIKKSIGEHIDISASDGPWPEYEVRASELTELFAAVKTELAKVGE